MKKKTKKTKPKYTRSKAWPYARRLPDREQVARLTRKEAAKQREVVDVVFRIIVTNERGITHEDGFALDLETQMTRQQLKDVQAAHAADRIWINYVKEPAR